MLILLALRDLRGDFRYYILNSFGSVGQRQAEVLEQDGEAGFGAVDSAKAYVLAGACGQDGVHGVNGGHFFKEFSRRRAQAARGHPLLQGSPEGQRQETHQDMGLCAVLFMMGNGPQHQVVFFDAEGVFDLREADVSFPKMFWRVGRQVGAQQVAALAQVGPLGAVFADDEVDLQSRATGDGMPAAGFVGIGCDTGSCKNDLTPERSFAHF